MAETLRVVTFHPSPPGRGSAPQKPRRRIEIDQGVAAIVAACILASGGVIGAIIQHAATDASHAATLAPTVAVTVTVTASPSRAPTSPAPSPTPTTWLNQLPVKGSGEVSPDGAHELIIDPADNINTVDYDLNRKYKTLNLYVKPDVPTQPNEGTTFIQVFLDGTDSQDANVGPGDQEIKWIIPVSSVQVLELRVFGSTQDINLLVSGALIS